MKGQTVIVRAYGNQPIVMRVWDADSLHVCVCSDEVYRQLQQGVSERKPIGFPREDVFQHDAKMLNELQKQYQDNPSVWSHMRVWSEYAQEGHKQTA